MKTSHEYSVFKNSLEDSIKCNMCSKYLDEPLVCSCSHCFCNSCIQRCDDNFSCPICKQVIILNTIKRSPFNNNFVTLAINVLNKIDTNKSRQFVKNRKRKKASQSNIPDTEKLPEIVEFKKKPINFILKGALRDKTTELLSNQVTVCRCKVQKTTQDFSSQVDFALNLIGKLKNDTSIEDLKARTIVHETPTKNYDYYNEADSINKSMTKSTTRMESILDLSTLRTRKQSPNSSITSNETLTNSSITLKSYYFATSLLSQISKEKIIEFKSMFEINISDDINNETTHLIVQTEDDLLCGVTTKYLKAISRKLWIISIQYVFKCLETKSILDFTEFEVQGDQVFGNHFGPSRSRVSNSALLANYEFLCLGRFDNESITTDDFFELVKISGAKIVSKAKDFGENSTRIVLFDEKLKKLDGKTANFMFKTAKIRCLSLSWFFDSLASYSIRDIKLYTI